MKPSPLHLLFSVAIATTMAMVVPGGVVVEGRLLGSPAPGASSPLTITVTKGNLEYFGRLLISLPTDCQLKARQIHGAGMSYDAKRNLAVISWLKLPEAQQFDLLFDLEVAPQAEPGPRSFEWDFSFIRNNDRETVHPTPFHFEVFSPRLPVANLSSPSGLDPPSAATTDEATPPTPSATRTIREMRDGRLEVRIDIENLPLGGFVKCVETIPEDALISVTSGGGSTVQTSSGNISFVWFDYQPAGSLTYFVQLSRLHAPNDFIGTLSYIHDDTAQEITVLPKWRTEFSEPATHEQRQISDSYWYEVQVAATKKRVVTDYFNRKLNFSLPLEEESDSSWVKYLFGHFEGYRLARDCREDFNERYGFIGPFVVSKRNGERVSVQEALTKTGETWVP